ncbi:MAG: aminotransferase class V-fold PLP-dependent enzyme [Aggregatilineales bacterium]
MFETYQRWQLELERQPVKFLGRRIDELLDHARADLAAYLNADVDDIIFVPNATTGINMVARSLRLQPGDEILTTDHEYGAMDFTWQFVCDKTGASYIHHPIALPVTSVEETVESFWQAVTPRTRVIFMSHITSSTALILPIDEICRRARKAGILTVIDGAHVPGQLPLDLKALDADFYTGNCHKWLCAPKGCAFLHVRRDHQPMLDPLVISWGWLEDASFVTRNQWQGTRDPAAFLSVSAAIEFQRANHWDEVRWSCHALASRTRQRLADVTGLAPLTPDSPDWFAQMIAVPLPEGDTDETKTRLYDEYHIEVPTTHWNDRNFVRISIQGYNTPEDLDYLVEALVKLYHLPVHSQIG